MKIDLVIFDFDGVLVDSEIIAHRIGADEMSRLGFPLSVEKSIELFSGIADEDMMGVIRKEYGDVPTNDILDLIVKKVRNSFLTDLRPVSNILEVLNHLSQGAVNKCIASNAPYDHVTRSLASTGMDVHFDYDKIFSASMVKNGKPMPDLFLHAANQCQANPKNCIVIEDSVVGIRAAKAANMSVVAFLGGLHAKNGSYGDRIKGLNPWMIANDAADLLDILIKQGV